MTDSIEAFVAALKEWAAQQPGILGVAIVGSHTRREARPDSDVDVIAVVDDPANSWNHSLAQFAGENAARLTALDPI